MVELKSLLSIVLEGKISLIFVMSELIIVVLSFAASWLINWIADLAPEQKALSELWSNAGLWFQQRQRRYIAVMFTSIVLGLLVHWKAGWSSRGLIFSLEAWFFLAIAVIDLEHRRVLNRMLLPALPVIVLVNWWFGLLSLRVAFAGAALGFGVFLLLALLWPGGMGMGDVKLAGVIGLATGLSGAALAIQISILGGGIAGLILLVAQRRRGITMAYAPYLVLGAWVALFRSTNLWLN